MIFFSFFKTLVGKEVAVEMKNDVRNNFIFIIVYKFFRKSRLFYYKLTNLQVVIIGTLVSVDQYLNVKLKQVKVVDSIAHPQLLSMKNCFIRGSAVRYHIYLLNYYVQTIM